MKTIAKYIALSALVILIAPPLLFLAGTPITLDLTKTIMLVATVLWFASAAVWMWPENNTL
jgi:hypothetical protein